MLPGDTERSKLIKEQLTQDTPVEALWVLRNSFTSYLDMADALARLGRVSHRLFYALHGTLTREIGRNAYFNPLVALEFRNEFDRIRSAEVLEALERVRTDSAHRVLALTFLTLFRSLRYLSLVDEYATDSSMTPLGYLILSVFRSDIRALTRFLSMGAASTIADGFERDLLQVGAQRVRESHAELADIAGSLVALRSTLETCASTLRIEVRKTFERGLPAIDSGESLGDLGPQIVVASAGLRATIHNAIHTLCTEMNPGREVPELALGFEARKAASERLRRDVWMFGQILRAFLAKARAAEANPNRWEAHTSFGFVREFLRHFRAIGYQLLRRSDYRRLEPFLEVLEGLRDVDLLDRAQLEQAIAECDALFKYLESLFQNVSQRTELKDVPFDRHAAADTLRIYLGAA
jgi:hypothetical protein